ncbi:MAG: hypothetical protein IJT58_01155 [Synergistaceae bacterium]|nr:hypothetical protein [Synergistaceae bacterium]
MKLRDSKIFIALVLSALVILGTDSAFAANIGKQPMTAVEDVVAATGVDPALKKDSLLYTIYTPSNGELDFKYVRFGDDYNVEVRDDLFGKMTSAKITKISGLYPAVSKNYTTSTVPPAIVLSTYLTENNLYQVSREGNKVSVTDKSTVKTGNNTVSWSGYKDISALKGGIAPVKFLRLSNGMNTLDQALSISICSALLRAVQR